MISQDIKYSFNQLETCIIAFLSDFRKRLQEIVPNCPVYFQNNGDFSYFVGRKFIKMNTKDIYLKTPRIVLKIEDIQPNTAEDTNMYNTLRYKFEDKLYQTIARRKAYNITIQASFVSPSYISLLNHIEIMAIFAARDNVFTYGFLGNTIHSAYTFQSASSEMASLDVSSATRDVSYNSTFELQAHLWVPKIETIETVAEATAADKVLFDIEQHRIIENDKGLEQDIIEYEDDLIKNSVETDIFDFENNQHISIPIDGTELGKKLMKQK